VKKKPALKISMGGNILTVNSSISWGGKSFYYGGCNRIVPVTFRGGEGTLEVERRKGRKSPTYKRREGLERKGNRTEENLSQITKGRIPAKKEKHLRKKRDGTSRGIVKRRPVSYEFEKESEEIKKGNC